MKLHVHASSLGARPGSVIWLVMKDVFLLLLLSSLVRCATRLAGASMIALIVVASLAGLIPARRASRIDPILALRYE